MPPKNENGSHSHSRRACVLTTASGAYTFVSGEGRGRGCACRICGGIVTVRDANMCSYAGQIHELGICRGAARRDNYICVLYTCTFVRAKFSAKCLWVALWVWLLFLLASVIQRRHLQEEKNRKKRSTKRGCQTLATLLLLLCEQARQGAVDGSAVGDPNKIAVRCSPPQFPSPRKVAVAYFSRHLYSMR